jgi:hypothetical protein
MMFQDATIFEKCPFSIPTEPDVDPELRHCARARFILGAKERHRMSE